ncbi:MAG: 30S ribosomal protein S3 [bacterium]|nr:30S ribosomal protein S3 [bacterium]
MGQKVHPKSLRIGYLYDWDSKWFAKKTAHFADFLEQDIKIREYIKKKYFTAGISSVGIERAGKYVRVNIHTARPGVVIGKKGADVENLRRHIEKIIGQKVFVNIIEVKTPDLDAQLVANNIALQIGKKISYKRAMKKIMERVMNIGAQGIKVMVSGRLGGAEIARSEWLRQGRVPLQTFRADVDYALAEAYTTYGQIGVKVWIFTKEHLERPVFQEPSKIEKSLKN